MKMARSKIFSTCIVALSYFCFVNAELTDRPPPRYNLANLPQTKFTCEGKFMGRYYADSDTDCQMFHVCSRTSRRDISDFKFLCPNGTVFDQEHQVCADYNQVVCHYNIGNNPLGHLFEIFKLSTKQSTNRNEFGTIASRDDEYLGQNNLGTDDFQVEEYNNNKLASSRNTLPFQSSKSPNLFQSTTTTTTLRPNQPLKPIETQHATRRPRLPTIQKEILSNAPTARRSEAPVTSSTRKPTISKPVNFSRAVHKTAKPREIVLPETDSFEEDLTEVRKDYPASTLPINPTQFDEVTEKSSKAPSIFDDVGQNFNDFASLSKFQKKFHGSLTHPPRTTQSPTFSTEGISTTTFSPLIEYTESDELVFSHQYDDISTTQPPTTRRDNLFQRKHVSRGSRKFKTQEKFNNLFSTTENSLPQSTVNIDFNTRPRSETQSPSEFHATRRPPLYQNTFRTTYQDVTTPGPQTFKQQPSHFNEEFFSKIVSKNEFFKNDDEDDFYYQPTTTENNNFIHKKFEKEIGSSKTSPNEESLTSSTTTTDRPVRRRRPNPHPDRQRNRISDPKFKFARRVENVRFEGNGSQASLIAKVQNEEIFKAEASVHSGTAGINSFKNNKRTEVMKVKGAEISSFTTDRPTQKVVVYGRKIRPSKDEHAQDAQDDAQALKEFNKQHRGRKRIRQKPSSSTSTTTTTTERITEYVSPTTYRPINRILLTGLNVTTPSSTTTTTEEPELVTASDEEVEKLRSRIETTPISTNTKKSPTKPYKPLLLSLKVTSKSSYQVVPSTVKPLLLTSESRKKSSNLTRTSDYDYNYYDTDHERHYVTDVVAKQDKFGAKSTKVIKS